MFYLIYNDRMDPNYHRAAAIFGRFRRALLTDDQPAADQLLANASQLAPLVREEFQDDLMEYEIFLLAGVLANLRQIQVLKARVRQLSEKIDIHSRVNSSKSSSP